MEIAGAMPGGADEEELGLLHSEAAPPSRRRYVWVASGCAALLAVALIGDWALAPRARLAEAKPGDATELTEGGGACSCDKATDWDGSFGQFADDKGSFCEQNFGGPNPYISGAGGDGNNGGWSDAAPCTSGQYALSKEGSWNISVAKADAQAKGPYRAFAYIQFCNGKKYSECWEGKDTVSFSFSFRTDGLDKLGTYIKLLFWTDSGNIVGLLPPKHQNGKGKFRLLTFPKDDYPNKWGSETEIEDGTWFHMRVDFTPATKGATVYLNDEKVGEGTLPVDMLGESKGPQFGVYSFDFSNKPWDAGFALSISDVCIGKASGTCPSGAAAAASS